MCAFNSASAGLKIRIPKRVQTSSAFVILFSAIRFPLLENMGKDMKVLVNGTIFAFFPK